MEEAIATIFIIVILFIIITKKKEKFVTELTGSEKNLFIQNLEVSLGELLQKKNIKIEKIKNSNKIMVKNITKLESLNSGLLNYNLELIDVFNNEESNKELKYSLMPFEPKTNIYSGYFISNNIQTLKTNKNYGFYFEFNPELEYNNFAEIILDFNISRIKDIEKIQKAKKNLLSDEYYKKSRRSVKIYNKNNSPRQFLNYFDKGDDNKEIDLIAVFTSQNNNKFLNSLPKGHFNILTNNLIPILVNVKSDNPICNIDLDRGGEVLGRDKLIGGKYNPEYKKYSLLESQEFTSFKNKLRSENQIEDFLGKIDEKFSNMNEYFNNQITEKNFENKYLSFKTIKDCRNKKNKEIMENIYKNKNISLLNNNSIHLKNDKDIIKKLVEMTDLKVRKHFSLDKYYFGGINNEGKMVCLSKNRTCNLYDKKEDVIKIENKNNEFMEMDPTDELDPGFVGQDLVDKYIQFANFNCIKERKKISPCKHILDRTIVDILTFKNTDKNNYVEKLNNYKILDLHKLTKEKFIEDEVLESDMEYQNKLEMDYLIEPYDEKFKNIDLGFLFEKFNIKFIIKDNNKNPPNSILSVIENNTETIMKMSNTELLLKKEDKFYIFIDDKLKLHLNILRNKNIISSYISKQQLKGFLGDNVNLFIRTNNNTIFHNIFSAEKISNLIYPYNPFIKVSEI